MLTKTRALIVSIIESALRRGERTTRADKKSLVNFTMATSVMSGRFKMRIQIIGSNKVESDAMAMLRLKRDAEKGGLNLNERVAVLEDESTETLLAMATVINKLNQIDDTPETDIDELERRIEALEKQVAVLLQLYGGKNV